MSKFMIVIGVLTLTGCGSTFGQPMSLTSGLLPSFACKGKGTISFQGAAIGAAQATALIDCGDGLVLQQLQPAPAESTK